MMREALGVEEFPIWTYDSGGFRGKGERIGKGIITVVPPPFETRDAANQDFLGVMILGSIPDVTKKTHILFQSL